MSERRDGYYYSMLRDYLSCPELYVGKHIEKSVKTEPSLDMEFGTALHMGLEYALKGEDGKVFFDSYWETIKDLPLKRFKFDWKCLEYNGHIFLDRFARLHASKFKPVYQEERIYTDLGGKKVEGTPDMLGEYEGVPSIIDFKTTATKYEKEKIICEEQLSFYSALAMKALNYVPRQKVYVVFNKDFKAPSISILKTELTEENISSTVSNMMSVIEQIESKRFYRNTNNCVRGKIVCESFERCWSKK